MYWLMTFLFCRYFIKQQGNDRRLSGELQICKPFSGCEEEGRNQSKADAKRADHTSPGQRPGFIGSSSEQAPKARFMFAESSPVAVLVPDVPLVERSVVLPQQLAVFLLEGSGFVMSFLVVDVSHQVIQLTVADRKSAIASLPEE